MIVLYYIGVCASFGDLIASALEKLSGGWLSAHGWLLVLFPFFCCLALLPNLTAVAKLVPLAVAAVVALCSIIVCKSALDSQRWQEWTSESQGLLHRAWPQKPLDVGVVIATLFGAFAVNGNVPSLLCEMKEPLHFPFAFRTAIVTVCFHLRDSHVCWLLCVRRVYARGHHFVFDVVPDKCD